MTNHKVVCFFGSQETHYDMEKTVSVKTESDTVKVAVITSQNKIITKPIEDQVNLQLSSTIRTTTNTNEKHKKRFNAHKDHKPTNETDAAITFINKANLGWKADVCKL